MSYSKVAIVHLKQGVFIGLTPGGYSNFTLVSHTTDSAVTVFNDHAEAMRFASRWRRKGFVDPFSYVGVVTQAKDHATADELVAANVAPELVEPLRANEARGFN